MITSKLIATAYNPLIHIGHRGAALNALCSLIGRAKILGNECRVTKDTWFQIFSIFLDRSNSIKAKPLRQLLSCLVNLMTDYEDSEKGEVRDRALSDVLRVLVLQSDHVKIKPALQVLSFFISKQVVSNKELEVHIGALRTNAIDQHRSPVPFVDNFNWLLQILFDWIRFEDAAIPAGQAACVLVKSISQRDSSECEVDHQRPSPFWAEPLAASLRKSTEDLSKFRSHLLPELFKLDISFYAKFLEQLGLHRILHSSTQSAEQGASPDEDEAAILFMCLEVGKEVGIVLELGEWE